MVNISLFGKDHWSLLAYINDSVSKGSNIQFKYMRCNKHTHPQFNVLPSWMEWKPEYGTKLNNGTRLDDHDDWNCLDDLKSVGLINMINFNQGIVELTPYGIEISLRLIDHKNNGNVFNTFCA